MLPVYSPESHSLYQDFLISNFLLYYPDPFSISRQTWKIIVQFWHLDLSQTTSILLGSYSNFEPAPLRTSARLRYKKVCSCSENGISHCNCKRLFSQPDCNIGWDSSRDCYFSGYHLYMFVASDSANDLPVFPILERASRHDMLSFLHTFFTMKTWLPECRVTKLLLDAAHDADAVYRYCQESGIQPFIDLNSGNTDNFIYKDTFTINNDGVSVCKLGLHIPYFFSRHSFSYV